MSEGLEGSFGVVGIMEVVGAQVSKDVSLGNWAAAQGTITIGGIIASRGALVEGDGTCGTMKCAESKEAINEEHFTQVVTSAEGGDLEGRLVDWMDKSFQQIKHDKIQRFTEKTNLSIDRHFEH